MIKMNKRKEERRRTWKSLTTDFVPNVVLLRDNVCPSCGFGETIRNNEQVSGAETSGQQPRPYEMYMNTINSAQTTYDPNAYNTSRAGMTPIHTIPSRADMTLMHIICRAVKSYGQNGYYKSGTDAAEKSNK